MTVWTIRQHWLEGARRCKSPNFNERPEGDSGKISLIVVHNISLPAGCFGGQEVEQLFTNCLDCEVNAEFVDLIDLRVSAHLFIRRSGELVQFVPFDKRAWHAGVSHYQGRNNVNDFSIGIELEGTDHLLYEEVQYQQLSRVIQALSAHYQFEKTAVTGHCHIAPGRKTDPGPAFDWEYLGEQLAK